MSEERYCQFDGTLLIDGDCPVCVAQEIVADSTEKRRTQGLDNLAETLFKIGVDGMRLTADGIPIVVGGE